MGNFKQLTVWKVAHELAIEVYRATGGFPNSERFGLQSQIRRAATSVPSNIAEGGGRQGDREMARFLLVARGSVAELEYQLLLARDLALLDEATHAELSVRAQRVNRMLLGLARRLAPDRPK